MKDALQAVWLKLRSEEEGVTTVEYAVMLFLVAIAVLLFGQGIANSVTDVFNDIVNGMT
jgi:Flp pilus assembly pilin Flp